MVVDSSIDLELQLKKRARRRLVGAIALVLLMIIVLPMVLHDRSADQPRQEVTITIPSEVNNNAAKKADFASNHVAEQLAPKPLDNSTTMGNETQQTSIVDTGTNQINSENKPIEKKAEDKTQTDSANVIQSAVSASNTKFYVQIGVFSDADNVKKLQAKLSGLGYQTQTEKISTDKGEKIRLRTTTFKDRSEAAIALENIKSSGLAGIVVSQK